MGNQCFGQRPSSGRRRHASDNGYGSSRSADSQNPRSTRAFSPRNSLSALTHPQTRLASVGFDVDELITETLHVIRTLVNNEQEPPSAMLKLNIIAEKDVGWIQITEAMVHIVPLDNPLGPAVITLFLDESPLPTKDTVSALLARLNLTPEETCKRSAVWNRNACIVLGCIAEKLAGANSAATFKNDTMDYLIGNLSSDRDPNVILFSLIALEKYAQTTVNRNVISDRLNALDPHPLELLEHHNLHRDWSPSDVPPDQLQSTLLWHQVGFCAQSALDNIFIKPERVYTYEQIETTGINAMLNHQDVSEYLKISPNGLEARCDVLLFESVRCTCELELGVSFYEVLIITPGVMQIGWATKDSKFFNHEGFGIGDDEYSVAYDGCRQFTWHAAKSIPHKHPAWKPGDYLGCLLDLNRVQAQFYLNGVPLDQPHRAVFHHASHGFFAAASFMSFQQCRFNFGAQPFRYAPNLEDYRNMNEMCELSTEQRTILPRRRKLELLRSISVPDDACQLCYSQQATIRLMPCKHDGLCATCALQLDQCPLCRAAIMERQTVYCAPSTSASSPQQQQPSVDAAHSPQERPQLVVQTKRISFDGDDDKDDVFFETSADMNAGSPSSTDDSQYRSQRRSAKGVTASQSLDHPLRQATDHPLRQATDHPLSQSLDHPLSQSLDHPLSQSLDHPLSQSRDGRRSTHLIVVNLDAAELPGAMC